MAIDAARDPTADIQAALRPAIGLLVSDPAGAETMAREILGGAPDNPDALTVLGSALRAQGKLDAARAVLEPLAATAPDSWVVQFELAQTLVALGLGRPAAHPLSRAVALNPGLASGWRLLGDIAMVSGQVSAAREAYDRLLAAVIPDPRLRPPALALAEGRLDAAERDLRAFLARQPAAMAAAHLLGEVLMRQGRLAPAEALLAECLVRAPGLHMARQSYASALFASGKHIQALAELDRILSQNPDNHRAQMMKAASLIEIGDYAAATEVTARVLEAFPDQPQGWLVQGAGLRILGRIDEAVAAWRTCIELDPGFSEAWWSLANLKAYRFTEADQAEMEHRLAAPALPPQDGANLHFTLGKADEDAGRYAEAFGHYAEGAVIEHARRGYDPAVTSVLVQASKALFTPAFFAERVGWGEPAADPIFIVGLPRSGSTLVDQILASHPAVEGTRELHDIQAFADWAARETGGYPQGLASLPPAAAAQLGHDYLERTRPLRKLGRPRFIDKAPWNFLHTGLIQLALPNARIVDVRRHPLGCGLSLFKQHFAQGFDFSYDLGDIGRYYADYVELMAHFDAVLPGRVHRVIYEDLVADTEAEVRKLLDYLGLPFDPACLRFFENPRAVATPSSEQVRRPIFADATTQWRHFEPWLDPLKEALGPVLAAYPSPPPVVS